MALPQLANNPVSWRFCLAPMMQRTDRHFRYLMRLIAPNMRLYTEMVHVGAILHGDCERFLAYSDVESPLALQVGGSEPRELAAATRIALNAGYDEVNLNCGCPSDRVQAGKFGACLMREPARVRDCYDAMAAVTGDQRSTSIKTRLGVDELYSYEYFRDFIGIIADAGCRIFHVHARKAWLEGLSPRENREIPPLEYQWVHRLKAEFPHLVVIINGGLNSIEQCRQQLSCVDGVMLGRAAYDDPFSMRAFDQQIFEWTDSDTGQFEIVERYLEYIDRQLSRGIYLKHMSRHLLNLFRNRPGAKLWRRYLTQKAHEKNADSRVIRVALDQLVAAAT